MQLAKKPLITAGEAASQSSTKMTWGPMRNFWFAAQKEGCGAHRSGLELHVVQRGVFSHGEVFATSFLLTAEGAPLYILGRHTPSQKPRSFLISWLQGCDQMQHVDATLLSDVVDCVSADAGADRHFGSNVKNIVSVLCGRSLARSCLGGLGLMHLPSSATLVTTRSSSTSKFGIEIPRIDDEVLNSSTDSTNSTSLIHCIASVGNCEQVHTSVLNLIFQQAKVAGVGNLSK